MSKAKNEMRLTAIIQEWLDGLGWDDEIDIDHEGRTSTLSSSVNNDGVSYTIFIEAEENSEWLSVFMYSIVEIPKRRFADACELANIINLRLGLGRFAVTSDQRIQFKSIADLEGCKPTVAVLKNLVTAGDAAFTRWFGAFGKIIFTDLSPDQIVKETIDAEQ